MATGRQHVAWGRHCACLALCLPHTLASLLLPSHSLCALSLCPPSHAACQTSPCHICTLPLSLSLCSLSPSSCARCLHTLATLPLPPSSSPFPALLLLISFRNERKLLDWRSLSVFTWPSLHLLSLSLSPMAQQLPRLIKRCSLQLVKPSTVCPPHHSLPHSLSLSQLMRLSHFNCIEIKMLCILCGIRFMIAIRYLSVTPTFSLAKTPLLHTLFPSPSASPSLLLFVCNFFNFQYCKDLCFWRLLNDSFFRYFGVSFFALST